MVIDKPIANVITLVGGTLLKVHVVATFCPTAYLSVVDHDHDYGHHIYCIFVCCWLAIIMNIFIGIRIIISPEQKYCCLIHFGQDVSLVDNHVFSDRFYFEFLPSWFWQFAILIFLASQDALEVMSVTDWLTDWVIVHWLDWCDPCKQGYLQKT